MVLLPGTQNGFQVLVSKFHSHKSKFSTSSKYFPLTKQPNTSSFYTHVILLDAVKNSHFALFCLSLYPSVHPFSPDI